MLPNTRLSRLHFISVRAVQMPQPRQASCTPQTSASTWRLAGHVWALQSASSCGCPPVAGPDPEANGQSHPAVPCLDGSRCVGWQGGAATSVRSKALPPLPPDELREVLRFERDHQQTLYKLPRHFVGIATLLLHAYVCRQCHGWHVVHRPPCPPHTAGLQRTSPTPSSSASSSGTSRKSAQPSSRQVVIRSCTGWRRGAAGIS